MLPSLPIRVLPLRSRRHHHARVAATAFAVVIASVTAGVVAAASTAAAASPAPRASGAYAALPAGPAAKSPRPDGASTDLGRNVVVFDPSMPVAEISAKVDAINAQQVDNEMGTQRYALLFKPGTYGTATQPLQMRVGYYTEVAGLGDSPDDVVVNGKIEVYNRCLEGNGTSNCLALVNFWRTLSNLTIKVNGAGQDGCRQSANFWAVSQAVSMRRVDVIGGTLSLMDYCTAGPHFASGGYLADSRAGQVVNGSQQQWLTRNSTIAGWSNGVWNQVFAGVEGAPDDAGFPDPPYTTLDTTPVSREKPFLFLDGRGSYQVRVPSAQRASRGTTWDEGLTAGRTLPLSEFLVATPATSVRTINHALARGRHLLLTPGVYDVERSIAVKRPNTVVLGIGHATLTAVGGAVPLTVADVPGVVVAGVTVDAGTVESPTLMRIGKATGHGRRPADPTNPTTLNDVYFRVGGPHVGSADVSLEVNSDHVLLDHIWAWRADHGVEGFGSGAASDDERWRTNIGRNGVVVNGDHVTATGLFVEHYQQFNTIWNGQHGTTVLYQNELPYDPPTQADWMHDGVEGWAGYKVADTVRSHRLFGGGVYVFNQNNPDMHTDNGFEVPLAPDVRLHHIMTVNLGAGTIDHVVNGVGSPADTSNTGQPQYVVDYPTPTP